MWKASPRSTGDSSIREERDLQGISSAGEQGQNDGHSISGQQSCASTTEFAHHGIEPAIIEDDYENLDFFTSNKQNGRKGSSTSQASIASQGGKLLKVFKRKVHLSGSFSRTSSGEHSLVHDAKEADRTSGRSQEEEILSARQEQYSVERLHEELQGLRQRMAWKEAEMERLRNEVSSLRSAGATDGGQSHPTEAAPQVDTSRLVSPTESLRSGASQSSCLDFSLASNGALKLEGKVQAQIAPVSQPQVDTIVKMDSFLSEATSAFVRAGKDSKVTKVGNIEEVWSTAKGTAFPKAQKHVKEQHLDPNKRSLDESTCKEEISHPECVENYCRDHTGADLKFVETGKKKTEFHISTPTSVYKPEESFFYVHTAEGQAAENSESSRSPPGSSSGTEEPGLMEFPSLERKTHSNSDNSLEWQKADPLEGIDDISELAGPKISGDLASLPDLNVLEKLPVVDVLYEEKALEDTLNDWRKDLSEVLNSSPATSFISEREHGLTIVKPSLEPKSDCSPAVSMKEVPLKVTSNGSISFSRSQVASSLVIEKAPLKVTSKISHAAGSAGFLPPRRPPSRHMSLELGRARLDAKPQILEFVPYPELQLDKLSKTMKILRRTETSASSNVPDLFSRSISPSSSGVAAKAPHSRSLQNPLQTKAVNEDFSDHSRGTELPWITNTRDLESKALSMSRTVAEPIEGRERCNVHSSQRNCSSSYGGVDDLMGVQMQPNISTTAAHHGRFKSLSSYSMCPTPRALSPSTYSSKCQFHESQSRTKSGSNGDSTRQALSSDVTGARSAEVVHLEEEVGQCFEESRQLHLSNATSRSTDWTDQDNRIAWSTWSPRTASFSVLAESRHRRSMQKSRASAEGSAEMQQDREQHAIALYEHNTQKVQHSTGDNVTVSASEGEDCSITCDTVREKEGKEANCSITGDSVRVEAETEEDRSITGDTVRVEAEEAEDCSIISPRRLREAMEAWDKKRAVQLEARKILSGRHRSLSPLPLRSRRTRFYSEANAADFSKCSPTRTASC